MWIDEDEDIEYWPSNEQSEYFNREKIRRKADCMKCTNRSGIQCLKGWKITHDSNKNEWLCFFYVQEFITKEEFNVD